MTNNPSEIARELYEERDTLLDVAKRYITKGEKETILKRVFQIERELDLSGLPGYNRSDFFSSRGK